eukprot:SAG31_NODE_50771_length_107_cov_62.875000_1_plen_20_part_01
MLTMLLTMLLIVMCAVLGGP